MSKRLTISIPDELFERIQAAKDEYLGEINTSQICQKALANEVARFEAHRVYENTGREDGAKDMPSLPSQVATRIASSLNEDDPEFKGLSIFDAVQLLEIRLQGRADFSILHPRHGKLFTDSKILHDWLKYGSGMSIEDKQGEVAWSYVEGWYQGVKEAFFKLKGGQDA